MHIPAVGIVAEYNPLHRGHLYHIGRARELSGADSVVAVMSGPFVQRGEPALTDKWRRAQMALDAGVSLVLELPVVFAAHNAGVFASSAVDLLAATGVVSHISFGVESPEWQTDRILDILLEEPAGFKALLQSSLKKGYSFVEARALALERVVPGSAGELRWSNNILALSYLLRIRKKGWPLIPVPVQRVGAGYHETESDGFASATGVRKKLSAGSCGEALALLPESSAEILRDCLDAGRACIDRGRLWNILRAILLRSAPPQIAGHAEIGEGIENRLRREALNSVSFQEWAERCTSKRYPRGRIQRHAIHLLLGLEHWTNRSFQRLGPAYIRVLAADERGRRLLRRMRKNSHLPVITRCGAAKSVYAERMMSFDVLAAELWEQLVPGGEPGCENARITLMR